MARLILVSALLLTGIVVMATGPGPAAGTAARAATRAPAPAMPADPCAGAAWPYRPAGCAAETGRASVRVIGAPIRIADGRPLGQ
ncbi:hypothetical protein [Methylobacterium sp. ID0610]|uniref:hypothetical protein n=1 Tax=Methylobacterium carpenticola TaxID=3344827 RepID=UPI003683028C